MADQILIFNILSTLISIWVMVNLLHKIVHQCCVLMYYIRSFIHVLNTITTNKKKYITMQEKW